MAELKGPTPAATEPPHPHPLGHRPGTVTGPGNSGEVAALFWHHAHAGCATSTPPAPVDRPAPGSVESATRGADQPGRARHPSRRRRLSGARQHPRDRCLVVMSRSRSRCQGSTGPLGTAVAGRRAALSSAHASGTGPAPHRGRQGSAGDRVPNTGPRPALEDSGSSRLDDHPGLERGPWADPLGRGRAKLPLSSGGP